LARGRRKREREGINDNSISSNINTHTLLLSLCSIQDRHPIARIESIRSDTATNNKRQGKEISININIIITA